MTAADAKALLGDFWPYAVMVLIGFLPTEIWRVAAVLLAERAAKAEADVIALGWKASQLEREVRRLTAERAATTTGSGDSKKTRELFAAVAGSRSQDQPARRHQCRVGDLGSLPPMP